jgi:hypothetical protein
MTSSGKSSKTNKKELKFQKKAKTQKQPPFGAKPVFVNTTNKFLYL